MNGLEEIKNFGPYMVKIMNLIGIHSREDLMASDYKTIKKNLIVAGVTPHLNIFYSIEMGLQGRSWNEITANEKNEIQKILEMCNESDSPN
jgi:DNA transformation protein